MKIAVRALVVVLALTGAAATASMQETNSSASAKPVLTRTSAYPVPSCPPGDPSSCGLNSGQ